MTDLFFFTEDLVLNNFGARHAPVLLI